MALSLGFGMNLTEILAKGAQSLPIIVMTISTSLVIAFVLYRAMNIRKGRKPIELNLCCWIGIALMSLGMQHVPGIW